MKKYLDNKFIMGTIILLTGGFFSKFLGFILKIIVTRMIGIEGVELYSLINPTFGLFPLDLFYLLLVCLVLLKGIIGVNKEWVYIYYQI